MAATCANLPLDRAGLSGLRDSFTVVRVAPPLTVRTSRLTVKAFRERVSPSRRPTPCGSWTRTVSRARSLLRTVIGKPRLRTLPRLRVPTLSASEGAPDGPQSMSPPLIARSISLTLPDPVAVIWNRSPGPSLDS